MIWIVANLSYGLVRYCLYCCYFADCSSVFSDLNPKQVKSFNFWYFLFFLCWFFSLNSFYGHLTSWWPWQQIINCSTSRLTYAYFPDKHFYPIDAQINLIMHSKHIFRCKSQHFRNFSGISSGNFCSYLLLVNK